MSSDLHRNSATSDDVAQTSTSASKVINKHGIFDLPSAHALGKITESIACQFQASCKDLAREKASIKLRLQSREHLESSLHNLASKYALAEAQLQQLQTPLSSDSDSSQEHPHLRVLKQLASQQQQQLSKMHQERAQLDALCAKTLSAPLPADGFSAVLGHLEGVLSDAQAKQSSLKRASEEIAQLRETLARQHVDQGMESNALAALQEQFDKEQTVRETLRSQNLELQRDVDTRNEHVQTLQRELQQETAQWTLGQEELAQLRVELGSLTTRAENAERANAARASRAEVVSPPTSHEPASIDARQEGQQLKRAKALWQQSERQLAELNQRVAQLQREKSAALSRAGILQNRLEENFKLTQHLKKEVHLASAEDERDQSKLKELHENLQTLRRAEATWSSERLDLQKQLVEQAQISAEAKQRESRLQTQTQQLEFTARELRQQIQLLESHVENSNAELFDQRRTVNALAEEHERRLLQQRQSDEAKQTRIEVDSAAKLLEMRGELTGFERQNAELQRQLTEAIGVIDDSRLRSEGLVKENQQAQKTLQQLVDQLRDKDLQAQHLQRQVHKRSKEALALQEQLTGTREAQQQLQSALRGNREMHEAAQRLEEQIGDQAKQIERLEIQVQRGKSRLVQLEELERSHTQLRRLLDPLKQLLHPTTPDVQESLPREEDGSDLFETHAHSSGHRAQLFD